MIEFSTDSVWTNIRRNLKQAPRTWLITGVAGFIGSNLLECLLRLEQQVVGLDNFATGKISNLEEVRKLVGEGAWRRFKFIEGDIRDPENCRRACEGADLVLHQAALGSVPRSLEDPLTSNDVNITGTLQMLLAACEAGMGRFVYAASSSTYGDHPRLPKVEEMIGRPLSPYAVTKYVNELYADVVARSFGLQTIGLRYFNVFGPRQDPEGAYAAVIPRWISSLLNGDTVYINGTGETSRDFCFVANAVQANLLAATTTRPEAINQVYNVAYNTRTNLNQLYEMLRTKLLPYYPGLSNVSPVYRNFRKGDVLHSQAEIAKAQQLLGYSPTHTLSQGLDEALEWYRQSFNG